jgi:hypothetical protein
MRGAGPHVVVSTDERPRLVVSIVVSIDRENAGIRAMRVRQGARG